MNKAFTFYESFYDAINDLDDETRLAVYDAVCMYGITGKDPKIKGVASTIFKLIKPNIDANLTKRNAGSKGGKGSKNESKTQADAKQNESKTQADGNRQDKTRQDMTKQDYTEQNKTTSEEVFLSRARENKNKTAPPTREMVNALFLANGLTVDDAQVFWEYNNSKKWPLSLETAFKQWDPKKNASGNNYGYGGSRNRFINFDQRGDRDPDYYERIVQEKLAAQEAARVKEG